MIWTVWWLWLAAALLLGLIEILIPAQVFLGFAIGAALTGFALLFGVLGFTTSLPLILLVFALLSLAAWIGLRFVLGVRPGQVKYWDRDINED